MLKLTVPSSALGVHMLILPVAGLSSRNHARPTPGVHRWVISLADEYGQLAPIIGTTTHYSTSPGTRSSASKATHRRIGGHGRAWERLTIDDRRALTPLIYSNVNPYGVIRLDLTQRLALDEEALS